MLQLQNVTKSYRTNLVLHISSFQLNTGLYWIKGANGSGKTTLLKMIAGLLSFEGEIIVNNISLKKKSLLYRQQISWSEAEPLFPFFMSGMDMIKLYSNIRKTLPSEADALIAMFSMNDYIGNPIGTYSAGMTKKLSLLLSFLGNASLILLDEPLITLDADTVVAVCHFIVKANQNNGTSFLISSHQDIDKLLLCFDKEFIVRNKMIAAV